MCEKMNPGSSQRTQSFQPEEKRTAEEKRIYEEKRRARRQAFRRLHETISENATRLVQPGNEELIQHVETLNQEVESIDHPRELAIDTSMMRRVAEMAQQQAEGIRIDCFDMEDYTKKLAAKLKSRQGINWTGLGTEVSSCFKRAPSLEFVYGALSFTPRAKAARKVSRMDRPPASETARPQAVDSASVSTEEATTKDVHNLLVQVRKTCKASPNGKVHYFKFLIHPTSFSQSIENIFHLSFLIKDGRVAVTVDDNQPYISLPVPIDSSGQTANMRDGIRNQTILSLDMALWQRIVHFYKIEEPMITPLEH